MNGNDLELLQKDNLSRYQKYRLRDPDAYRAKKREYAKTPEERKKRNEYMQKWKDKNRERTNQLARESHKRNRYKHVEKLKDKHLMMSYGITMIDKKKMILRQGNKCLICEGQFKNSRDCHIDHNHFTGQVRGVLCHVCNTKLGWYEKNSPKVNKYLNEDFSGIVW